MDVTQGRIFREAFIQKLALLLRGTVAAPPERFGETLADEHIRGGSRPAPFSASPALPSALDEAELAKPLQGIGCWDFICWQKYAFGKLAELALRGGCMIVTEI